MQENEKNKLIKIYKYKFFKITNYNGSRSISHKQKYSKW
jgi:hypothetical protein